MLVKWKASTGSARPVMARTESHGSMESRSAMRESKALVAGAGWCAPAYASVR
jgi:hypothetical protein